MALTRTSPLLAGAQPDRAARWPRPPSVRSVVIFAHDLAAALASLALALLLFDGGRLAAAEPRLLIEAGAAFAALAGGTFLAFGLHRPIWSCTSTRDLGALIKASTWAILLLVALGVAADRAVAVAPAVPVVQWLLLVGFLAGTRLAWRFARIAARRARAGAAPAPATPGMPVLLYGCGPLAALFVGAIRATPGTGLRLVGIIEDAGTPRGRSVHDVPVLGAPADLDRILADLAVQGIHPHRLVVTRAAACLSPAGRALVERWRARHDRELQFLPDLLGISATAATAAAGAADRARSGMRRAATTMFGHRRDRFGPALAGDPGGQRLLVVNRFFHPDTSATSQLLTDLVEALAPRGFAITVLAGRDSYLNTGAVLPARASLAGIAVRRLRHTAFGRFSLPGRALDGASFAAAAFLALIARARPGDLILAKTDPPLISVLAWLAARLTGARLVNWCQDLFPETAAAMGLRFARGPLGAALRAVRNASLCGAETNVALSPGMAARLAAQGVPPARIAVIPNWADGGLIRPLAPERNPLRAAWGLSNRFVIGYSGNLGHAHAIAPVIELITLLTDQPDVVFLFIGAGSGYRALGAAIADRRLQNVVLRPYQEREQLGLSLSVPDLHLVTLQPAWEGLVMPSKLYGALAAGRPVVFVGDPAGDTGRIVGAGLGLVASPDGIPALAEQILALRRDPARLAGMGAAARRAYEAVPKDASLDAWTRCLRAAALPAATPLPQAAGAD